MKKYIVYRHSSKTTGKVYIGITCQNPIKRWGKVIGKPTAYGYKWKFEDDLTL